MTTTPCPTHLPMIAIVGNTYPVRDELKALGCKWDRRAQLWYAPVTVAVKAQKLVSSQRRGGQRYQNK